MFNPLHADEFHYVPKGWGYEKWIINDKTANYCLKEMFLVRGKSCSLHKHLVKNEHFFVVDGRMKLFTQPLSNDVNEYNLYNAMQDYDKATSSLSFFLQWMNYTELVKGQTYKIPVNMWHSFYGITDCKFYEVSTFHDDADVVRLCKGD